MHCDRKDSRPFAILCHLFNGNKEHWISSCCRPIHSQFLNGGQETAFFNTFSEMFERIASKYVPGRQRIYMGTKKTISVKPVQIPGTAVSLTF